MAKPSGKPTLATIAAELGVSRATVSNAFNRPEKLSPALRARILSTAERLGYGGPDPTAAGLRRGRVGVVGVVVPDGLTYAFSDPAVVEMLDGMAEALDEAGLAILLLTGGRGRRPAAEAARTATVDGFVLYGGVEEDDLWAALQRRRLPVVGLSTSKGGRRTQVDVDEEGGSRAMAAHLLDLGHRSFGIVTLRSRNDGVSGPMGEERRRSIVYSATRRRLSAALEELAGRGIEPSSVPVYEVDHNHPSEAMAAAGWLWSQPVRPTAVICQSDQLAIGVLEWAERKRVKVPRDLSVGGFDDIVRASLTSPPLTTVRQPLHDRGHTAGRLIVRAIDGQRVRSASLPTELVVRASTGPPPAR